MKNISFGVNNGEIFGLLGPNGAGKSTTFNISTGMIHQTAGTVRLMQRPLEEGSEKLFQEVGICPQFDCIWENLTAIEHLSLFGRIKGLSKAELEESMNF